MPMKYVRFPGKDFDVIVIFTPNINHIEIAKQHEYEHWKPTSAGFINILHGGIRISGRSSSLNLGPAEDDAEIVAAFMAAV